MDMYTRFGNSIHVPERWVGLYEHDRLETLLRRAIAKYYINYSEAAAYPLLQLNPPARLAKIGGEYWCLDEEHLEIFKRGLSSWGVSENEIRRYSPNWERWNQMGRRSQPSRHADYARVFPNVLVPRAWVAQYSRTELVKTLSYQIGYHHLHQPRNQIQIVRLNPPGYLHVAESGYAFFTLTDYRAVSDSTESGSGGAFAGENILDGLEAAAGVGPVAGAALAERPRPVVAVRRLGRRGAVGLADGVGPGMIGEMAAAVQPAGAERMEVPEEAGGVGDGITGNGRAFNAIYLSEDEDDAELSAALRRANQIFIDLEEELRECRQIREREMLQLACDHVFHSQCMEYVEIMKHMEWEE